MAGEYRNSLGFLNLQLRAQKLQQDQQRQAQVEQFGREAQQQDFTNALDVAKQQIDSDTAIHNRKLQLADLLQRAQMAEEGKDGRQKEKIAAEAPKRAAETALKTAQAETIPKDDTREDTKVTDERNWRINSLAETARGHDLGYYGDVLGKFAMPGPDGERGLQLDPNFLNGLQRSLQHPATTDTSTPGASTPTPRQSAPVSPPSTAPTPNTTPQAQPPSKLEPLGLQLAPPQDPNIQRLPFATRAKIAVETKDLQGSVDRQEKLYEQATKLPNTYFGLAGSAAGLNTLKDLVGKVQTAAGKKGTQIQKGSAERGAFASGVGLEMAQTVRDFSGASSAEQEHSRLGQTTGITKKDLELIGKGEKDPFSLDQPVFLAMFRAAIDWKKSKKEGNEQVLRDKGVRIAPAEGGRREPAPVTVLGPLDAPNSVKVTPSLTEDQADARMDELMAQGLTEEQAYRRVKMELGLEGPKAAE